MAALTMAVSTFLNAQQIDYAEFRQQTLDMVAYARKHQPQKRPRQPAMARAALRLYQGGAPWQDLRLPIAAALLELYGALPDTAIAGLIEAMLPIEDVQR